VRQVGHLQELYRI